MIGKAIQNCFFCDRINGCMLGKILDGSNIHIGIIHDDIGIAFLKQFIGVFKKQVTGIAHVYASFSKCDVHICAEYAAAGIE